ncbi:YceI-like domain-containing protein [Zhouia amylolytica]|uniref:YceI-like domain-containing protein n=1 Tax=Zhouia amylolytica TaxID=376730 RepID=A0A1I6RSF5_9FLAO|nr:YceI family protein [Zhouia amylolytica]SFS67635.1 YceI-like domain-containing protein [Zhouia amylolytica]
MKKQSLKLAMVAVFAALSIACKNDKKNEAQTNEAEVAANSSEEAIKFNALPTESTIEWVGSKPTGSHTGTIAIESGVFSLKNDMIESGSFSIDMNSITVTDLEPGNGKENLEAHLKGNAEGKEDHFFNVKEHPKGSFEITGLKQAEGQTVLEGNLTLKGIKKNIAFPVNISVNENNIVVSSEVFTINRTDWGVNYGSKSIFEDLGDKFINDDIELKISIKANKA